MRFRILTLAVLALFAFACPPTGTIDDDDDTGLGDDDDSTPQAMTLMDLAGYWSFQSVTFVDGDTGDPITLSRADDASTGARLVGAMLANDHQVRANARRTLEDALGDDLEDQLALGRTLSITQAAHLALGALEAAIDRLEEAPA